MDKYDIVLVAGQSNAEGFGRGDVTEEYIPDERIRSLSVVHTETWNNDTMRTEFYYPGVPYVLETACERKEDGNITGEFPLTFAKAYIDAGFLEKNRKILIVRGGVGDTGFTYGHWKPDGFAYQEFTKLIRYAQCLNSGENRMVAFLWHQGEHDGIWKYDPNQYNADLRLLVQNIRQVSGVEDLPFVCGGFCPDWAEKAPEQSKPIEAELRKVAKELGAFVETADLQSNRDRTGDEDWIHFCRESQHILGKRYFEAYCDLVRK